MVTLLDRSVQYVLRYGRRGANMTASFGRPGLFLALRAAPMNRLHSADLFNGHFGCAYGNNPICSTDLGAVATDQRRRHDDAVI